MVASCSSYFGYPLVSFILARPHLTGSNVQAAALAPPQATVILVDNSLSMQYRDGQETRLQRAKTLASRLVQGLAPQDSAVVLPLLMPEEAANAPVSLSHDQTVLQEQLAALQPSHATVDCLAPSSALLPSCKKALHHAAGWSSCQI